MESVVNFVYTIEGVSGVLTVKQEPFASHLQDIGHNLCMETKNEVIMLSEDGTILQHWKPAECADDAN